MSGALASGLLEIAGTVEILSEDRFRMADRIVSVNGARPRFAPTRRAAATEGASPRARLVGALTDELYAHWYTRARSVPGPEPERRDLREHLHRLSSADGGRRTWERGWKLRSFDERGEAEVERLGITFRVPSGRVRPGEPPVRPGSACSVRVPTEMRGEVPGSWCTRGETDLGEPGAAPSLLRLYWHLRPEAAPPLVRALTVGLDRRRIPFRLKVLSDPRDYRRADAGVLFLAPGEYRRARDVVRRAYSDVRDGLRPEVPRLAWELAPGLGLSEGPGDGESFGGHRCGLIAEALVGAFAAGTGSEASRREAVREAFDAAGLDPRRPHLAAGSGSRYGRFRLGSPAKGKARGRAPRKPRPAAAPLDRAAEIGDALCRSAFHAEGRSNWLGVLPAPAAAGGTYAPTAASLGADLYGGTAGIALFLAELHAVTGAAEHRRTALGALRQALSALRSAPGRLPPVGFYEGRLGVAWAARRIASLTGDEDLAVEASDLLSSAIADSPPVRPRDVLAGDAGAILALLALHEESGEGRLLEAASRLGGELVVALTSDPGGPGLTGFSHGAAGLGLALLELSVATGTDELRQAADRLFEWEDALFHPARRNWPDLRRPGRPGFMVAWCHGAPGVALARLRAMEIDPARRDRYETAAHAGLATTLARIDADLARPEADACLCHGLAGLIEIVAYAATVLDDRELRERARAAEQRLAGGLGGRQWSDPSLLTGAAGVGYAMLRAAEPGRLPPMLFPGRLARGSRPADRKEA